MAERTLSCFIDESGDFGPYEPHSPYYVVSMVLHDQNMNISEYIQAEEQHVANLGYPHHALHTGPLIRREADYLHLSIEERKHLFNVLFHFTRRLPIQYICVKVRKIECDDDIIQLTSKLSRSLTNDIRAHNNFFESFDKIKIYYDNGQINLTKIITTLFTSLFSNIEIKKVKPVDYKLFQVADLICTIELLSEKAMNNSFTNSEREFFYSIREFRKKYLKWIQNKRL